MLSQPVSAKRTCHSARIHHRPVPSSTPKRARLSDGHRHASRYYANRSSNQDAAPRRTDPQIHFGGRSDFRLDGGALDRGRPLPFDASRSPQFCPSRANQAGSMRHHPRGHSLNNHSLNNIGTPEARHNPRFRSFDQSSFVEPRSLEQHRPYHRSAADRPAVLRSRPMNSHLPQFPKPIPTQARQVSVEPLTFNQCRVGGRTLDISTKECSISTHTLKHHLYNEPRPFIGIAEVHAESAEGGRSIQYYNAEHFMEWFSNGDRTDPNTGSQIERVEYFMLFRHQRVADYVGSFDRHVPKTPPEHAALLGALKSDQLVNKLTYLQVLATLYSEGIDEVFPRGLFSGSQAYQDNRQAFSIVKQPYKADIIEQFIETLIEKEIEAEKGAVQPDLQQHIPTKADMLALIKRNSNQFIAHERAKPTLAKVGRDRSDSLPFMNEGILVQIAASKMPIR